MREIYFTSIFLFISVGVAHAYVGPGLGLGVIGAILGVIVSVILAVVGFIWYPIKRIMKNRENEKKDDERAEK